jgi:hypothetical protein
VYEDSAEGERYKQFYPFSILPHVAIIDPRTGERLVQMGKMSSDEFISIGNLHDTIWIKTVILGYVYTISVCVSFIV